MRHWNEIQSAAAVAQYGSIGGAAKELRVHRTTIIRHLERLEAELGGRLFIRHSRGMAPTELGQRLQRVAEAAAAQFGDLYKEAKSKEGGLSGKFVITSVDVLSPLILPIIDKLQAEHKQLIVHYVSSDRVLKLAYGEADVAIRIGPKPQSPDNIVKPFRRVSMGLYANSRYIEEFGFPELAGDISNHRFVGPDQDAPETPFTLWLNEHIAENSVTFRTNSIALMWSAVQNGSGIGFLPTFIAEQNSDVVEILEPQKEWEEQVWIVTHVDVHHSAKVQAFYRMI